MNRRSSALVLLAACVLPANVGATAATEPEMPRPTCVRRIMDNEGDAYANPSGNATLNHDSRKTPGLDIVSAYLRTTADQIQMFVKIKDIPAPDAFPATDPAYRYLVSFKVDKTTFTFMHQQKNKNLEALVSGRIYPGAEPALSGMTGAINATTDMVYMTVPRATVEQKAAVPLVPGEPLAGLTVKTEWMVQNGQTFASDSAAPAADSPFRVDDDYCFGLPPATVAEVSVDPTQFGDVAEFSAKLVDEVEAPLANEQVTFTVPGSAAGPLTATTDATGVAAVAYTADLPAGTYPVTVSYAGSATIGRATGSGDLVISPETTKFPALTVKKTSTTGRAVTATLVDGESKPLAAQKVAWYVNGKLASTLTTDAAGRSVLKTAKAGQTVQARFAGVAGKYVASKSNTPKV